MLITVTESSYHCVIAWQFREEVERSCFEAEDVRELFWEAV